MELTTLLDLYLWMLPADSWIALPVVVAGMWLLIITFPRSYTKSSLMPDQAISAMSDKNTMVRKDIRIQTKPTIHAELSDGKLTSFGVVTNISKEGMCIRGVSGSLSSSGSQLLVHVSDANKQFWVLATPRWSQEDFGGTQIVGLAISPTTSEWPELVTTN